jgi:3-methyl-2-oxobutanoate hydroxymethyltransferase
VPVEVAKAISERTPLIMLSMGAGTGCDAQYLFADDILGQNRGHMPRHSKVYRNFAAEYDRLQAERVAAFSEYVADVNSGAYPEDRHVVRMDPAELRLFLDKVGRK